MEIRDTEDILGNDRKGVPASTPSHRLRVVESEAAAHHIFGVVNHQILDIIQVRRLDDHGNAATVKPAIIGGLVRIKFHGIGQSQAPLRHNTETEK